MPVMWPEQSPVSTRNTYSLLILTTFQREGLTYLSQVLFDSFCYVPASVWDEAQQALQLVDPELQRFGSPCLEGLPGPLYDQLFPRHLKFKKKYTSSTRAKCYTAHWANQSQFYPKLLNAPARANGVPAWRTQNSRAWDRAADIYTHRSNQCNKQTFHGSLTKHCEAAAAYYVAALHNDEVLLSNPNP